MLTPTAIAVGLTWIGGAVLLGVLLDVASPAGAAVGGLIWSGAIVALLGAAGEGAAPTPLLAPALIIAVAWAIWDRADRPDLRPYLPSFAAGREPSGEHPSRVAETVRRVPRGARGRTRSRGSSAGPAIPRPRRSPTSASGRRGRRQNTCGRHSMAPVRKPGCPRIHPHIGDPTRRCRGPGWIMP